jgi:hypothetical protein
MEHRYDSVNTLWNAITLPPVTREEATRGLALLCKRFGGTQHGGPSMARPYSSKRVRECWITRSEARLSKGWARLVHDVSHAIFSARHPGLRPHHPAHVAIEREMTAYVIAAGWLGGSLKSKAKEQPPREARLASKREQLVERLARWQTKQKRAGTAIRKLQRQLKAHDRNAAKPLPVRAERVVAPKPERAAGSFPFSFAVNAEALSWFAGCEEGAAEDGEQAREYGVSAYDVLSRHRTRIEVRNMNEAKVVCYAAHTGTLDARYPALAARVQSTLENEFGREVRG